MQYISPEAIEGEAVDNRADIYSLGCTAFHLLAGQPPFTGTTIASMMSAHLTKPVPSISAVNPRLPHKADAVFERVLAKSPDDRYQSCAEFVTALQEAIGGGEVRYPASAPTLSAATVPKRGAVDPDAPTKLRSGEATDTPLQRKSRAVPILAAAGGVLAVTAVLLGFYATRGGSGETPTTNTSTTATSTNSSAPPTTTTTTTSSTPPPPPPSTTPAPAPSAAPPRPTYPPAGALGSACPPPGGAIGTGPDGAIYYCSRVEYTDGYEWSLTPGVIPNTNVSIPPYTPPPPSQVDPNGPSPMEPCATPGAVVPGTLGLTQCSLFYGRYVWGLVPRS